MKTINDIFGAARDAASLLTFEQQAALVEAMCSAVNRSSNPVPELVNVLDPEGYIEPERTNMTVIKTAFAANIGMPQYQRITATDADRTIESSAHLFNIESQEEGTKA